MRTFALILIAASCAWGQSNPVIQVVAVAPMVALPETTWTTIWAATTETGGVIDEGASGVIENWRDLATSANISDTATVIRLKLTGTRIDDYNMVIHAIGIGVRSGTSDDYVASPAPAAFSYGGSTISAGNPITIARGDSAYTDALVWTIDTGTDYLIHFFNGSGFAHHSQWSHASLTKGWYNYSDGSDLSLTQSYDSQSATVSLIGVQEIQKRVIQ